MKTTYAKPLGEGGFTLIEVLVSMLIFSFALLGLVGMQARALQVSYDAEDRMRASLMANEIIATMWSNGTVSLPSSTITSWNTRVATATVSGLPNGVGTVGAPDANGVVLITLTWQAPSRTTGSQYVTQIALPPAL